MEINNVDKLNHQDTKRTKVSSSRIIVQILLFIVVVPCLPLLIAWRWDWWEAWVYAILYIGGFIISRALAARRHPDLLAERARATQHEDAKSWDKVLAPLVGLGGGLIPLVAGLDARFAWSGTFGWTAKVVSLLILLAGYGLASYALVENRFFSGMVRIQSERGHQVVSGGPYRWMRHPGYAGAVLMYMVTPVFLDSWWAFLPAVLLTIVLVIRAYLEDKTLQEELEGYHAYAEQVRYRLLPGVW
jgi:protein-S-isoprenylcysteine O-methyltransferase Ste14